MSAPACGPWSSRWGWSGDQITLEPVDELIVLSVCDNTIDILLPDQGVARRMPLGGGEGAPTLDAVTLEGGKAVDAPLAQHGFSALVTATRAEHDHRLLFDTGMTPAG